MSLGAKISSFIKRKTSQKYRFNLQYEHRQWDGLRNIDDLGRYSLLVGYTKFFAPHARILDLGCGEGVLQERFVSSGYAYYLGVDISDVAIQNAAKKENSNTRFIVGDLDKLTIEGTYDVIIYNESIYYMKDPVAGVKALFKNLSPGGVFIISCFNKHGKEHHYLWNDLNEILALTDRTMLTNKNGDSWTLHVYKMKDT